MFGAAHPADRRPAEATTEIGGELAEQVIRSLDAGQDEIGADLPRDLSDRLAQIARAWLLAEGMRQGRNFIGTAGDRRLERPLDAVGNRRERAVLATTFKAASDVMIGPIFVAAIVFSALVGLANGWIITKRKVSPFLATLAMMIILQGVRFAYTGGAPVSTLPPGIAFLANGLFLGLPVNLWVLAALALALGVVLARSKFGRLVYMVGGNPKAAELVGIASDRVIIACYVICSVLAGIARLFLLGYVGTVSNWVGQGYELDSIIAAVMGGVALGGGSGTVSGALLGVAILVVISNLVLLLGLPIEMQLIVKGLIIIGAAAFYRARI
jgi:ribose/xylose/arabinose/galactoside ABC-type transport system permease subunit